MRKNFTLLNTIFLIVMTTQRLFDFKNYVCKVSNTCNNDFSFRTTCSNIISMTDLSLRLVISLYQLMTRFKFRPLIPVP